MEFQCPHCNAQFETQRSGRQFCPNCGQQIDVAGPLAGPVADSTSTSGPGFPSPMSGSAPPSGGEIPPIGPPPPGWMPPGGPPPTGGPPPPRGPSLRRDTPWERRGELGFLPALAETWKQTVTTPEQFFSSVKPIGRWEDAFLYAWLLAVVSAVAGLILKIPFHAMLAEQIRRSLDVLSSMRQVPVEAQRYLAMFLGVWVTVFQIILWPIWMFIGAALVHLFCIVFGCASNGFWATFRALAYAQAPVIFLAFAPVPCIGWVIAFAGWVLMVVLQIWGVMRLQETSAGKAAAAVLATPVLACCCGCTGLFLLGGALKSILTGGS